MTMIYLKNLNDTMICNLIGIKNMDQDAKFNTIKFLYDMNYPLDLRLLIHNLGYKIQTEKNFEKGAEIFHKNRLVKIDEELLYLSYTNYLSLIVCSVLIGGTPYDLKWKWIHELLYPDFVIIEQCINQCFDHKDWKEKDILKMLTMETLKNYQDYNFQENDFLKNNKLRNNRVESFNKKIKEYFIKNKDNQFSIDKFIDFLIEQKERSIVEYKKWVKMLARNILDDHYKGRFMSYIEKDEELEEKKEIEQINKTNLEELKKMISF